MEAPILWTCCFGESIDILPPVGTLISGFIYKLMRPCGGLNPFAEPWHPLMNRAPESDRCLFLTFSKGHPITENEILTFFTHKYGNCVEKVYVHWAPPPGEENYGKDESSTTAQFGKVVFTGQTIPLLLTACGGKESKFLVHGKPLWCKRFDPSKARSYWKS